MPTPYYCYNGNFDAQFKGQEFVVNPAKVFGNSEDFSLGSWPDTLSNQGMLRVHPECSYGPSGIQGTISMANPPDDDMEDMLSGAKPPGIWDYYGMLGFIQIPHPDEYIFQVFFIHGSFFEREARRRGCGGRANCPRRRAIHAQVFRGFPPEFLTPIHTQSTVSALTAGRFASSLFAQQSASLRRSAFYAIWAAVETQERQ